MPTVDWKHLARNAQRASKELAVCSTEKKNAALQMVCRALEENAASILDANALDVAAAQSAGVSEALIDRLRLNSERIAAMVQGVEQVLALHDPVGETLSEEVLYNGLRVQKRRVPLGVIGIIYEARPNVTVDASALCLKAGNAVVLRGSSSALHSNKALVAVIQGALAESGMCPDLVQLIPEGSREIVAEFLQQRELLDVLIPRGGAQLIRYVCEQSSVPVIETGAGNCHLFIDASADAAMALAIAINAKVQRPSVCNAIETILLHSSWGQENIKSLVQALQDEGVVVHACERTHTLCEGTRLAHVDDWHTEFLGLEVAIKQVDSMEEAVEHISCHGTKHSESIVTEDPSVAAAFLQAVDAAAVYHNASTRFTDGFEFGFGAEIGISTQKLHARGPMGLTELTSYKYIIEGNGQIRS